MKNGLTLMELLLVFSIIAILSVFGTAAFINYNQSQKVSNASLEVVNILNLAKSRAASQVKPSSCTGVLSGYKVGLCKLDPNVCLSSEINYDYALYAVCGNEVISPAIEKKKLPEGITFDTSSATSFSFKVLSGGVNQAGVTKINGFGQGKCVTINDIGSIEGPDSC